MLDEVLLVLAELGPVHQVVGEVHLLGCTGRGEAGESETTVQRYEEKLAESRSGGRETGARVWRDVLTDKIAAAWIWGIGW